MLIGHHKKINFLAQSAKKSRVSHGYLFYGPEKIGKKKVAVEFIKTLQCLDEKKPCGVCKNCREIESGNHPDLFFLGGKNSLSEEGSGQIGIPEIRNLRKILALSSYSGNYKAAIIDDAHNLNVHAANALLKTLEEPKGKAIIILVSSFPDLLPSTIRSRLQQVKFSLVSNAILENQPKMAELNDFQKKEILKIVRGRPGVLADFLEDLRRKDGYKAFVSGLSALVLEDVSKRFEYAKKVSESKEDSLRFLGGLAIFFRDLLLIKSGINNLMVNSFIEKELVALSERYSKIGVQKIIKLINRLNEMILYSNVNSRLCLEVLMLEM